MLPWKTILKIDLHSNRAKYLQIADAITKEIIGQRIKSGNKLPSSRSLADLLGLNRKTVLQAYDELIAQGWIEIVPSKGSFVKQNLPIIRPHELGSPTTHEIDIPTQKVHPPIIGSINDGIPDYRITPLKSLYKTARSIASGPLAKSVMSGEHFSGEPHLKHSLIKYLSETRALNASMDKLMVTRGSQMAIFLALSYIINNGDHVIVGQLNYHTANKTIVALGGILSRVKVDESGLDIEQIETVCKSNKIKAIYISPHHHYPTTVTMPIENRLKLLELANHYNFYIIEDDYDYDYHYLGSPILPLASIDQAQKVIYIGSFSKIFAPSVRIGYMYAHPTIIENSINLRKLIDRRGDPIIERALSILIEENEIKRSIKKAVQAYKQRRDLFCSELNTQLGAHIEFKIPDGGMAIWASFVDLDIDSLVKQCLSNGLSLDIDTYSGINSCRLGFTSMTDKEIVLNTSILSKSLFQLQS
ncbi:MAG: PLP-dependent aminotransferase family protein [Reichenbachiella sp.]